MTQRRPSKTHCLKAYEDVFDDVRTGRKPFEYRQNDRDYAVGDVLVLQEYRPETDSLTGEACAVRVTYLLLGGRYGVPEAYCIMGVTPWPMPRVSGGEL